jgi:hypothetical protein
LFIQITSRDRRRKTFFFSRIYTHTQSSK